MTSRTVDAADVISPDVVTIVGGSANFNTPNVGTDKPVTLTGATTSNPNYSVGTIATDTANITKRNVTGSFTAADKDFDGTTDATITSRSLNNEVAGDAVSLTGGTAKFNNPDPGNDKTVTGTGFSLGGSDAPNYNLTSVGNTTADIQRRPAGNIPPPKDVKKDAEKALGGDVKELPFDLNGLGYAFAPADQTGTLKVGKRAIKLFAIGGCDAPVHGRREEDARPDDRRREHRGDEEDQAQDPEPEPRRWRVRRDQAEEADEEAAEGDQQGPEVQARREDDAQVGRREGRLQEEVPPQAQEVGRGGVT